MGRPIHSKIKQFADGESEQPAMIVQNPASERIVYLSGEVTEHLITQIIAGMISLANHDHTLPITLVISTYGGSVDEMFSLYDAIKYLPCKVQTVGIGKIMSAGVLLLASGEKGKRLIGENARIMIHPISGAAAGNVFQVIAETKEFSRQQEQMERLLQHETKMTKEDVQRFMNAGHDFYMLPDEALRLGIVDQIIGSDKK